MEDPINIYWNGASTKERNALGSIYDIMKRIPISLPRHVRLAHFVEILENHDHRAWPSTYQLHGIIPLFQRAIQYAIELTCVDAIQRRNYMILALAGQNRHLDVSYGLSEPLLWKDKPHVIQKILEMGRRKYNAPIPTRHDMDNGILHVALSYRHCNRFDDGGTLCKAQADAAWLAVRALPHVTEETRVRIWVDQNLHRASFPASVEWHEYGLLPYACLQIVFVGDGGCTGSLSHASTRPWLWVELLAGLKAHGMHARPGVDVMADCADVLQHTNTFPDANDVFLRRSFVVSPQRNVDEVMRELALNISMWRKDGFLNHDGYEYAHYFERFVNWSRRFLMRGLPYSCMAWNHGSDDVVGMDAVVLLRAMPRPPNETGPEALGAIAEARVSWRTSGNNDMWTVGDVIDRTGIDEIPLHMLMEVSIERCSDYTEMKMYGKPSYMEILRLRRVDDKVHLVMKRDDARTDGIISRFGLNSYILARMYGIGNCIVRYGTGNENLFTYTPFTRRVMIARGSGRTAIGDVTGNVRKVEEGVKDGLGLRSIGVCINVGVCEEILRVPLESGDMTYLSTLEVYGILRAVGGVVSRFREVTRVLKRNAGYKWMRYRDMSVDERRDIGRGWLVEMEGMTNEFVVSGEIDSDVSDELIDSLQRQYVDRTLVTRMLLYDERRCIVTFRGRRSLTRMRFEDCRGQEGMAVLGTVDEEVLERIVEVLGKVKLDERIALVDLDGREDTDSREIGLLSGLFVRCVRCQDVVCPLNGLVAKIEDVADRVLVSWVREHDCVTADYEIFR